MNDLSELVSKAKNGVQSAFTRLYELTEKDVWFTCISLTKHEENAKDVFQDTYITAFMKIKTLEDDNNFSSWIKRIAVNKCKDFFKGKVEYQLEDDYMKDFVETDELTIPEEYITKTEKRKIILQLMEDTLSYVQYQTVFMHYFDNMSVSDIAQVLECSEGTVKSRLNSARAKMKKAITDYENKNGDRLHSVVFLPLFSSIFKAQSNDIKVPKIKITFPTETGKITLTKGAETVIKGTGKGILTTMKSKVIATVCLLAVVSGGSTAIAMFAGCGENQQPSVIETTMNTEADTTTPTLNDTDQAIVDAGLKVDDKGNIVDENGKKVEVSEDGTVEIKTEDGKTIKVDVDKVSEANTNNEKIKNSSSNTTSTTKPSTTKATEKATEKVTEKATQATTKATEPKVTEKVTQPTTKATQPTTKATQPATQKPTQKPTQAPTQKPTEAPTEAPTKRSVVRCNDCNADLTYLYDNDMYAFDVHLYNHVMEGGKGSYRLTWEY